MQRKLLYVVNHIDWFWSHRLPLARAAQHHGWDVAVAVPGGSLDTRFVTHGFRVFDVPQARTAIAFLAAVRKLRRHIIDDRPRVIHAITLQSAVVAGLAAWRCRDVTVVHTIAGLGYLFSSTGVRPWILRQLLHPLLRIALGGTRTTIIVQNADDAALLVRHGIISQSRCHLIRGSGVDTDVFCPRTEPRAGPALVLMASRLVREKGIDVFIQMARILKDRHVPACFAIAGGPADSNPNGISSDDMRQLTADGSVTWLGQVADMPSLLNKATVVVYPSYYREGVPKVLLEAAAMARAIVTTDHPGCRDVVTHGLNGLLVPTRDPVATADAVERLLTNPGERERMGLRGRQRAEEEFTVARIVSQTLALYGR